ncbi:MAG: prephenate dehydrogenase, partial [Actinomycetota bacterium]|nr:prephenate dehydrogenase [Actinomycetota bacterium]
MTVPDVSNSISPIVTLGLGLIGGSLLRAAAPLAPVAGWSPTLESREAARSAGFTIFDTVDDAIAHAADTDALLVLAAPVTAFDVLLD